MVKKPNTKLVDDIQKELDKAVPLSKDAIQYQALLELAELPSGLGLAEKIRRFSDIMKRAIDETKVH